MVFSLSRTYLLLSQWLYPRYKVVNHLRGHRGAVTVLSVSPDGVLASGGKSHPAIVTFLISQVFSGYDGVKLWQLPSCRSVEAPWGGQGLRGTVSSFAWTKVEDSDVLIHGTAGGYLCVWRRMKSVRRPYHGSSTYTEASVEPQQSVFRAISSDQITTAEITGIDAICGPAGRTVVAASFLNGVVKLWEMNADLTMRCTNTFQLDKDKCLRSVRFNGNGMQVRAFSLYGGDM